MKWQEEYSVGKPEMDADHAIILNLIDEYQFTEGSQSDWKHAEFVIVELETYSKHHFFREEEFLKKIGFPNLKQHQQKHAEMLRKLASLKQGYKNHENNISSEISTFLSDWWEKHILIEDMEYKNFASTALEESADSNIRLMSG